jgi:hypothetical protein
VAVVWAAGSLGAVWFASQSVVYVQRQSSRRPPLGLPYPSPTRLVLSNYLLTPDWLQAASTLCRSSHVWARARRSTSVSGCHPAPMRLGVGLWPLNGGVPEGYVVSTRPMPPLPGNRS